MPTLQVGRSRSAHPALRCRRLVEETQPARRTPDLSPGPGCASSTRCVRRRHRVVPACDGNRGLKLHLRVLDCVPVIAVRRRALVQMLQALCKTLVLLKDGLHEQRLERADRVGVRHHENARGRLVMGAVGDMRMMVRNRQSFLHERVLGILPACGRFGVVVPDDREALHFPPIRTRRETTNVCRELLESHREVYGEAFEILALQQLLDEAYIGGAFAQRVDRLVETEGIDFLVRHALTI